MFSEINRSPGKSNTWMNNQIAWRGVGFSLVIGMLVLLSLIAGLFAANDFGIIFLAFSGGLIGILMIYVCISNPLVGFYLTTLIAFFAFYPGRLINKDLPISTFVEVLVLFLFMGTQVSLHKEDNQRNELLKSAVSILIVINVTYFLIQLFNPNMDNKLGWFFTLKRYAIYLLMYYISYKVINTPEKLRYYFSFWITWAFIAACYGCYQEWVGFLPMELNYLKNDPHQYKLLFQGGVIRKFSFLDGVVTFGILCGSTAVISLVMALNENNKRRKFRLYFMTYIMVLGMLYSGTRTTTIMLPCGIALYSLMTIRNKSTLITVFISLLVAAFLMFAPIYTPALNKMRSTFNSEDASLDVRTENRHYIQPYIYKNALGGGVNTAGVEGRRFNPNHQLAGFPPDSGLLKIALENGWIGLLLTVFFYLAIFYQGINYYFKMKSPEFKKYTIAITTAIFSIVVTQYSQVSIGQIPTAFFFYGAIAVLKRLMEFDEDAKELNQPLTAVEEV